MKLKHIIPIGTRVSFGAYGGSRIFVVDNYQTLLGPCESNCTLDHDCSDEPHILVREESWKALPLSKLEYIFDQPNHMGRNATVEEKTGVKDED